MPLAQINPGSKDAEHLDLSVIPEEIDPKQFMKKNGAGRPRHRDKPENKRHGWYSDAKKMEAACTYAVTGNARRVSELIKVPEGTIRAWKTTEWWHEVMSRIQQEQNEELDSKLTKLVDKAVDHINDRLDHGDYVYNAKEDKLIRKPVGAKDLSIVAAVTVDKRQLLRGQPTSRVEKVSENEKLTRLAAEFKKFAQAKEVHSIAEAIEEEQYEEEQVGREPIDGDTPL
jgi:hypothetical protein